MLHYIHPLSEMLCFYLIFNIKSALIGQLKHARASIAHCFSSWLCCVLSFQLASLQPWIQAQSMQMCDMVMLCDVKKTRN